MSNNNNHQLGKVPWLHAIISTGFGSDFFPKAPDTAGLSLVLNMVCWILIFRANSPYFRYSSSNSSNNFNRSMGIECYGKILG